ncbi:very short patch repair endonuclease [Halomonas sp. KM-1]|uniref:very short patch repair endonuclease n=1 Tax=Halomonas sp. KM-1 TaxID=590061 RepID=UPI00028A3942|nr:DNA mismatch endonuclease Vsr [Halomonas sp. KM-1]
MADHVDIATRSKIMRGVKSKNTSPEVSVRRYLHCHGYRFRLHRKDLPGKPDLILPKYRLAIFIHGCFWHRHEECFYSSTPKTRTEFWINKFKKNKERDSFQQKKLIDMGWRVLIIWQCGIRHERKSLSSIFEKIESNETFSEWPESAPKPAK